MKPSPDASVVDSEGRAGEGWSQDDRNGRRTMTMGRMLLAGVAGVAVFKVLATVVMPLLALLMGLVGFAVKLILFAAVVAILVSIFRRPTARNASA